MKMYDTNIPQSTIDFQSLMELYEQNYILLKRFLMSVRTLDPLSVFNSASGPNVCVWVEERTAHTTTLRVSYDFSSCEKDDAKTLKPNLTIRMCHDAQVAEIVAAVVNGRPREMHYATQLDWRWSVNLFLSRWMRFLLKSGYVKSFSATIK